MLPLYPIAPLDDQARAFPSTSENVVIVLLKVEVICAHPSGIFFLTFLLRWCYVFLDNFPSCFMIQKLSGMRYLNPSISSLDLSLVIFHLKLSLRTVAIYGAYK